MFGTVARMKFKPGSYEKMQDLMKGFEERLNKAFATKVRDLMSEDPVVVRTDDGVEKVARLIAEKHHNHLPVVDGDGKLAGIVTRADALAALVEGE